MNISSFKTNSLKFYHRILLVILSLSLLTVHKTYALDEKAENFINTTSTQQVKVGVLPGYEGNIFDFLNKIIRSSVSISLTLAVLMLVLAGFSAVQAKDSAKEEYFTKIKNVSTGLAIILLSYLIIAALFSLFFSL